LAPKQNHAKGASAEPLGIRRKRVEGRGIGNLTWKAPGGRKAQAGNLSRIQDRRRNLLLLPTVQSWLGDIGETMRSRPEFGGDDGYGKNYQKGNSKEGRRKNFKIILRK
jgi:hypothetical protein